jgi:hypothetical protein
MRPDISPARELGAVLFEAVLDRFRDRECAAVARDTASAALEIFRDLPEPSRPLLERPELYAMIDAVTEFVQFNVAAPCERGLANDVDVCRIAIARAREAMQPRPFAWRIALSIALGRGVLAALDLDMRKEAERAAQRARSA